MSFILIQSFNFFETCPFARWYSTTDMLKVSLPSRPYLFLLFLLACVVIFFKSVQGSFGDYHFFNSGQVVFGSSASYTERYIEHGTRNISYYDQYGTSCSRRTYVEATSTSYYAQFGTSCSRRSYVAALTTLAGIEDEQGEPYS